jgi:predicted nucleic acid-binding protein
MRVLHARLLAHNIIPTVPAPVLAEAWRGSPTQVHLVRLLATCEIEPLTDAQARRVGVLAGRARHSDIVDATVVEGAIRRNDAIVTSDPDGIHAIAGAASADLVIEPI